MNYNKKYLEEQGLLFSMPANLATLGISSVADIIGTVLRPPLDLAKQIGHEKRFNTLRRAGEQKFGSSQSEIEKAIEAALGKERESLAAKLGRRGQQFYQGAATGVLRGLTPRR